MKTLLNKLTLCINTPITRIAIPAKLVLDQIGDGIHSRPLSQSLAQENLSPFINILLDCGIP